MANLKTKLEKTIAELKAKRDELEVQMHLGSAEAKNEYEKTVEKFDKLLIKAKPVSDAVEESAEEVWASLELLGEEVNESFIRIAKSLKK